MLPDQDAPPIQPFPPGLEIGAANLLSGMSGAQSDAHSANWSAAFRLWLDSRRTPATRRAYHKACELLTEFTAKAPWEISKADVSAWIESQRLAGLSAETIHQRLAAVSSFYRFVARVYTFPGPDGREHPLHLYNPVAGIDRPRLRSYGKAVFLSPDQARAFLHAIPLHTLQGLRDYALFLAYLLTGRRNSEIRTLRWRDLELEVPPDPARSSKGFNLPSLFSHKAKGAKPPPRRVFYRWSGKGQSRRDECPIPVYQAIIVYLKASGRLEAISPDDCIFSALNDNARHLHPAIQVDAANLPHPTGSAHTAALSACMVGRLVKKYARQAGLDPERITVHTLRHTAAMLRKEAGDSLENISSLLAHSSYDITQIYIHTIEGRPDAAWQKVEALLGLPAAPLSPFPLGEGPGVRVNPGGADLCIGPAPPLRRRLRLQYR